MRVNLHPEAQEELEAAHSYYESREIGLGDDFLVEIEKAVEQITNNPEACCFLPKQKIARQCLVHLFPYALAYMAFEEEIIILAVVHTSRRPFYWKKRLRPKNR